MSWYKVSFSGTDVNNGRVRRLASQMSAAVTASGDPQTDALLVDANGRTSGGGSDVYFSPAAALIAPTLITEYAAAPCTKPDPSAVGLLAGRIPGYSRFKGVPAPTYLSRNRRD